MLELRDIKHQCRIDIDDTYDDEHLLLLQRAAQDIVEGQINRRVRWDGIATEDENEIPCCADIDVAVLMLIAGMYENRESMSDSQLRRVPLGVDYILRKYRLSSSGYLAS